MDLALLRRLAANLLETEIWELDGTMDPVPLLEAFEQRHCFSKEMQPLFTAPRLRKLAEELPEGIFLETEGRLHVSLMLFRFGGSVFLAGPYVKEPYNERRIQIELAERRVSYSRIHAFRLYYTALPLLLTETVTRTLTAILHAFDADCPLFDARQVQDFSAPAPHRAGSRPDTEQVESVYRNYRWENRFLEAIRAGQTGDALRMFDRKGSQADVQSRFATYFQDPKVSYATMRTLMRKAAEEGGLSIVTIDTITRRHAQLSAAARSLSEQTKHMRDLVRDLTEAVQAAHIRAQGCSPETKTILEYLHLHYSEPIRIEDLGALTSYSRSHISTRFKEDKGKSILQWVAMLRCHKAKELLENTDAAIGDIAASVGYDDSNYFVKVYKREIGETPSATREKAQR